ncbi:MAG: CoB--CoM heterodisulfide reductase iron-sulfur subunit B family protein, partial [Thermincolia bacterium]
MKYAYYPGCSLHSLAAEYDHSVLEMCGRLGIEMKEIPDWNCCGASSAHSTNHLLSLAIPARNLAIAEEQGLDVVAPCAACYQRLATVQHETRRDAKIKEKVNKVLGGRTYEAKNEVKSILDILVEYGIDNLAAKVEKPLAGVKVACYYGCYLVKPPKICSVDDAENPMKMDKIMEALGAEVIQWPYKSECCGGSLVFTNPDIVLKL